MPSARKLIAVPLDDLVGPQVDAEERVHERERRAGEHRDQEPELHEPVASAPQKPKNAPISIIPSRPMFTTPLRSEKSPPIAAKVERRRVAERRGESADQAKTRSRFPTLDCVASDAEAHAEDADGDRAPADSSARRA